MLSLLSLAGKKKKGFEIKELLPFQQCRILIISGPSGSGKSEISLNLALSLNGTAEVALIDLDIVKPLFRLRNHRMYIDHFHLHFVSPGGEWDTADLPILPEQVGRYLSFPRRAIIDVGGEATGARVLKQYQNFFKGGDVCHFFVVNPFRPFSRTVKELRNQLMEIEASSGLKVTGLISNPHLKEETTLEIIQKGHLVALEFSQASGLPIICLCVDEALTSEVSVLVEIPILPMKAFIQPPWAELALNQEGGS